MTPIIVITGPTGSGKSDMAIKLAKKYNGYIINSDSRQVYKELNVGTAKPKPSKVVNDKKWIVDGVDHYLFGFVSVKDEYNVYQYQKDVDEVLHLEENKNRIAFLVGGTGLYIDSIVFNFKLPIHSEEIEYKKDLEKLVSGLNESDRKNPRRISSILKRISKPEKGGVKPHIYLVVDIDKEELDERIQKRIDEMFENGLVQENQKLSNYHSLPSLNTIGYKEFKEEDDIEKIKEKIFFHTRQYAKRQRTWFRGKENAIYVKDIDQADGLIGNFLKTL